MIEVIHIKKTAVIIVTFMLMALLAYLTRIFVVNNVSEKGGAMTFETVECEAGIFLQSGT